MKLLLTIFALASLSGLALSAAPWNELHTTWPLYPSVPTTAAAAASAGWVQDATCASGSSFGNRFYKPGENRAASLIFNEAGAASGLQLCISPLHDLSAKLMAPQGPMEKLTLDGQTYVCATMFFRDPSKICTNDSTVNPPTGEGLWLKTGDTSMPLVTDLNAEPSAPWVKGQCMKTMGWHYWYNFTATTPCDELFPVFLLYNGGMLNAWGWVFASEPIEKGGSRFENPSPLDTKLFLPVDPSLQPQCIFTGPTLSTMHIAHNNPFISNYC